MEHTVKDIIAYASRNDAAKIKETIFGVLNDKLKTAISNKRTETAKTIFIHKENEKRED